MSSKRVRFALLLRQLRGVVLCAPVLAVAMPVQEGSSQVGEATMVIGAASLIGSDGVVRALEAWQRRACRRSHRDPGRWSCPPALCWRRACQRAPFQPPADRGLHLRPPAATADCHQVPPRGRRGALHHGCLGRGGARALPSQHTHGRHRRQGHRLIVRSTPDATLASVYSGAIVLAPMSASCSVTVGPASTAAKLLSDSMRGQMLALNLQQPAPRLVPATEQLAQNAQGHGREAIAKAGLRRACAERCDGWQGRGCRGPWCQSSSARPMAGLVAVANPRTRSEGAGLGRYWGWTQALDGDDFSRAFEQALLQGRESLGGNGAYGLLRQSSAGGFVPTEPAVNFRLASSAATVLRDEGRARGRPGWSGQPLGRLCACHLCHPAQRDRPRHGTGHRQRAQGNITSSGAMQMTSGNAYMLGGFNTTGSGAAYLFNKSVPAGLLQGVTLWGR